MKQVIIFCERYYDNINSRISIGGIQTYITNLCDVIKELGLQPIILQFDKQNKDIELDGIRITSVDVSAIKKLRKKKYKLYEKAISIYNEGDLLLYSTDHLICPKTVDENAISIQHGIYWDIPNNSVSGFRAIFKSLFKIFLHLNYSRYMESMDKVVCVDYNYPNWYRALKVNHKMKIQVIPNFTDIPEFLPKDNSKIKIIFARRFYTYRGTRVFGDAIKRILDFYGNNIEVTVAGEGPDEVWLRNCLQKYKNVTFIKYSSEQSLSVHSNHHIAIVPTVGSEGTSLSLLEAMASGCAVICTNVGGMTNIVLDHYNGLMINPDSDELFGALKELLDDTILRNQLIEKSYESVSKAFSLTMWKNRWASVFKKFM